MLLLCITTCVVLPLALQRICRLERPSMFGGLTCSRVHSARIATAISASSRPARPHATDTQRWSPTFRAVRSQIVHAETGRSGSSSVGNRLRIGSTVYKFAQSREIEGAIKTSRSSAMRSAICPCISPVSVPQPPVRAMTGNSAGFDFGLTTYLTGSDGTATTRAAAAQAQPAAHCLAPGRCLRNAQGPTIVSRATRIWPVYTDGAHVRQAFHWDSSARLVHSTT